MSTPTSAVSAARDPRAVVIAVVGMLVILAIVLIAISNLPGDVSSDVKNTKGESTVAIASAAFTAIASLISAYFGVKVANVAREESVKTSERHEATLLSLTGKE
jgi:hypothetical protein